MWVELLVCAAFAAHAALHAAQYVGLQAKLRRKEEEVTLVAAERQSERAGRTKAERELREMQLKLGRTIGGRDEGEAGAPGASPELPLDLTQVAFPLRPIGVLRSCFSRRNGTPRQPLLVPAARAALTLRPDLAADFLQGLAGYSHCWVLYVFHENTDLQRLWQGSSNGVRSKIRVPRLNGERMGVFATRSPHRPCPIGLSVAEVISVEGATLTIGGADIVDGSPVLDIKPYVPFCDAVSGASAPHWVAPTAEDEPLAIEAVRLPHAADAELRRCWELRGRRSLFPSYPAFRALALQALSRDIRSVTQRLKVPTREHLGVGLPAMQAPHGEGGGGGAGRREGKWHVVLDGIDITYEMEAGGVTIMSCGLLHPLHPT